MFLRPLFKSLRDYKVLVIGDVILDTYAYISVLGKASKENILATRLLRQEQYHGGVEAAAAHIQPLCQVDVWSGPQGVEKVRFIDEVYLRKLFELHSEFEVERSNPPVIGDYDLVIVTDFGHGAITPTVIDHLTAEAKFLAVNAQSNAANYGFNLITKYPRADFVVIDEPEARLAACDKDSPINDVILKLGFQNIIVTHGVHGSIGYDGTFCHAPAYTQQVVDTMGAGDAFFVITALLAKAGVPMRDLVTIGNAAGAAKVGIIGHQRAVTLEDIEHVLGVQRSDPHREPCVPVRERG